MANYKGHMKKEQMRMQALVVHKDMLGLAALAPYENNIALCYT